MVKDKDVHLFHICLFSGVIPMTTIKTDKQAFLPSGPIYFHSKQQENAAGHENTNI